MNDATSGGSVAGDGVALSQDELVPGGIEFTKMHGLGNDFMVVDATLRPFDLDVARIRALADRRTGIGFDQLLVVAPPSVAGVEFDYRIFNADGTEVEHCGNGARCFARFVRERGLTRSSRIPVHTAVGNILLQLLDDGRVTVAMGVPDFVPARVPFIPSPSPPVANADVGRSGAAPFHPIDIDGAVHRVGVVAIGNPHAVLLVDDVDTAPVTTLGPLVESHAAFPRRVNAGFLQVVSRTRVRLRVFERGVGETRACGSGACAAFAVGVRAGLLERRVTIELTGGSLELAWPDDESSVEMTGPCSTVFEGRTRA